MKRLGTTLVRASNNKLVTWRDAASLILLSPRERKCDHHNFEVLMLKRHAGASFYPNSYVFPGGRIDEFDRHLEWLDLFNKVEPEFANQMSKFFIKQDKTSRSPLFPGIYNNEQLPNEISFRICAIRESFEESGVLILTNQPNNNTHFVNETLKENDIIKWRELVHNNAANFIKLCKHLNMVPDIWCLHEWSNWLTPSYAGTFFKKRFDTAFYTCCLDKQPYTLHDEKETTVAVWDNASSILNSYHNLKMVQLGPPQIYELRRLLRFQTYTEFTNFVVARKDKGMRCWLPIFAVTSDEKVVSLYPGDDLYPDEDEIITEEGYCYKILFNFPHSEVLQGQKLNHFHYNKGPGKLLKIYCNTAEFGQVTPFSSSIPVIKSNM